MVELPIKRGKRLIESGEFEFETYLGKKELASFLRGLAEQLESGNEISINSDEWEIKSRFSEPIEVEIEFNGDERKLEIELKFKERTGIRV